LWPPAWVTPCPKKDGFSWRQAVRLLDTWCLVRVCFFLAEDFDFFPGSGMGDAV